jgi:hypothetical protein
MKVLATKFDLHSILIRVICYAVACFATHQCAFADSKATETREKLPKSYNITVRSPANLYKSFAEREIDPSQSSNERISKYELYLTKRIPIGGIKNDVGLLCAGPIDECATSLVNENYWLDQASGEVKIGNPTESVREVRLGRWKAYEAFPLCGWSSATGESNAYGGQCYGVVLSSASKTIGFQILLGRNMGARNLKNAGRPR